MHITQIAANVVDVGQGFMWAGRLAKQVIGVHVKIETNSGMAGHALCWPSELAPRAVAASIADTVAPLLVDTDPFDRVSALNPVWRSIRVGTPLPAFGVVDCALWDLLGQMSGRSVAQLLGQRHSRLKACASAPPCDSPTECAGMVEALVGEGFLAVKLHACGDVTVDVESCRLAREVAPNTDLMMDAMAIYSRHEALALGRALDAHHYRWYEDPLPDDDLDGWRELRTYIETPLAGVDAVRFTTRDYARPMADGAFDIVRMDAARQGITLLSDLSKVADAFGLGCEGHAFGPALSQAANLQAALAAGNAEYCELPVPVGALDFGVKGGLTLSADGYVEPSGKPGLGMDVDEAVLAGGIVK